MSSATLASSEISATRRLAADDIRPGMWLTVSRDVCEFASFLWDTDVPASERGLPVRFEFTPHDSGTPQRVRAVCLPYVFVKSIKGATRTIDLRQSEVTQLHDDYVNIVKQHSKSKKRKKRRGRQGKRKLKK